MVGHLYFGALIVLLTRYVVVAYDSQFDDGIFVPGSGMFSFQQQEPSEVTQQEPDDPSLARQQEQPPNDLGPLSFGSFEDEDQRRCRKCPRFRRRCKCRNKRDCRYIPRTCTTCEQWRCVGQ